MIFPMVSPVSQCSHFQSLRVVFKSASIPNHHSIYLCGMVDSVLERRHSQRGTTSLLLISQGMVRVLASQLICGFHFCSQGIPRIICLRPRLSTISRTFSCQKAKRMSV